MPTQGPPTPWWLPQQGPNSIRDTGPVPYLQSNAPAGYEYNPVTMAYTRTPTSAGTRVNEYTTAALGPNAPSLNGLTGSTSTSTSGATTTGGTGTIAPPRMPTAPVGAPTGGSAGTAAGSPSRIAPVTLPDRTAANAATFARAKDDVGAQSRASLDALAGEMGAQGMAGGGGQMQATRDVINAGAGHLGDVTRENAIQDAQIGADFAKTSYEGGIAQRGQDVAMRDQDRLSTQALADRQKDYDLTGYQGGITQRGQDFSREESTARLAQEQRNAEYQRYALIMQGLQKAPSSLLY